MIVATYIVLAEDRQTYCPRRVYIRVEEIRRELALGRFARVVFAKMNRERIVAALPIGLSIRSFINRHEKQVLASIMNKMGKPQSHENAQRHLCSNLSKIKYHVILSIEVLQPIRFVKIASRISKQRDKVPINISPNKASVRSQNSARLIHHPRIVNS